MTPVKGLLLGIIQGITEFFPVSSSGHLVVVKAWLGVESPGVVWEVALHAGTLVAMFLFLRREVVELLCGFLAGLRALFAHRPAKEIWRENLPFRLSMLILLGTLPAGFIGVCFEDVLDRMFANTLAVGMALLVTGGLLWWTRRAPDGVRGGENLRARDALLIGVAQAVAIAPGISRSGATISVALMLGVERDFAGRFSFLLAIPAIGGAMLLELRHIVSVPRDDLGALLVGMLSAAIVGFVALWWLLRVVRRGKLCSFAPYCWAIGVFALITYFLR